MKKNNKESSHLLIGDVCVYHEKKDGMIDNAYPIFDGEIATIVGFATIKGAITLSIQRVVPMDIK